MLGNGEMVEADTLPELADRRGADRVELLASIERFNGFAVTGVDPDFWRGRTAASGRQRHRWSLRLRKRDGVDDGPHLRRTRLEHFTRSRLRIPGRPPRCAAAARS